MLACCKAVLWGPRRKPVYRITRKSTEVRWYWRETLPHALLAAIVPVGFLTGLATGTLPPLLILLTTGYWGLVNTAALSGFIVRGWSGTSPAKWLRTVERRAATTTP
jgi:hypothetical protein